MVHEEIEELRKFGEEIKHSSKNVLSKYPRFHSRYPVYTKIIYIFYRLYSWIGLVTKWFYGNVKKVMSGIKKNLGKLQLFTLNKDFVTFHQSEKNNANKQAIRLIETKKQIGNITIIIRKRIEVPFNFKDTKNFSSYFFHRCSVKTQVAKNRYHRYESLFDVPMPLLNQKLSLGEKMKLFFLRL